MREPHGRFRIQQERPDGPPGPTAGFDAEKCVPWALKPPTPVDFSATPWRLAWAFLPSRCTRDRTFGSCFQLSNFLVFFSFRFPDSSDGAPLAQPWRSPRDKTSGPPGRVRPCGRRAPGRWWYSNVSLLLYQDNFEGSGGGAGFKTKTETGARELRSLFVKTFVVCSRPWEFSVEER